VTDAELGKMTWEVNWMTVVLGLLLVAVAGALVSIAVFGGLAYNRMRHLKHMRPPHLPTGCIPGVALVADPLPAQVSVQAPTLGTAAPTEPVPVAASAIVPIAPTPSGSDPLSAPAPAPVGEGGAPPGPARLPVRRIAPAVRRVLPQP